MRARRAHTVCARSRWRGSAIIAVLMLLVIGVIIAATVLVSADAARTSTNTEQHRAQSRALAWSGVQAVMAELSSQREGLLDGENPELTEEWSLYTLDDGSRGMVRLVDLDPESALMVVPENAKLDVNTASAEMLALVPGLDETIARRIVEARDAQPFGSVEALLGVEGITPEMLYGEPDAEGGGAALSGVSFTDAGTSDRGLRSYLTVFSFDPNVQVGYMGEGEGRGNLRVNLDQEWSDDLEEAIAARFDRNVAQLVKQMFDSGQSFATDSELVGVLIDRGVDAEGWGTVFDVFTTTDDEFLLGRVDVNRAGPEVLACVPGITPEVAAAIVDRREMVDVESRALPVWLVSEGLLEPEAYQQAADWVTGRSMQWRVRLEVGVLPGGDDEIGGGFDESLPMTMDDLAASWDEPLEEESRLQHRMVVEVVIDVASLRPRVAYMREVTLLDPVLAMVRSERGEEDVLGLGDEGAVSDADEAAASETAETEEDNAGLDFGGGLSFAEPESAEDDGLLGDEESGEDDAAGGGGSGTSGAVDRRIGRWTTRKVGGS